MSIQEFIDKFQNKEKNQQFAVGAEAAVATPLSDRPMAKRFTKQERTARRILIQAGASPAEIEKRFPSKL